MKLPQCEIIFSKVSKLPEIVFTLGGRVPDIEWFRKISMNRKIFAVDKGLEICKASGVIPDFFIGDFDSANEDAIAWAKTKKISIENYPIDKDFTDMQLALRRANEIFKEYTGILTGSFGGRFDHLFSTTFTCSSSSQNIVLADQREIVFYLKTEESIEVMLFSQPKILSLLPITEFCEGVTIKNVHWELNNATLKQEFPTAISNRIKDESFFVSLKHGILAIYLCFDENFSEC